MKDYLDRTESYLNDKLIPFWAARVVEPKFGGFRTTYDRQGRAADGAEKSLLCQARCLFTLSHAARLGFDWPDVRDALAQGIDFLRTRFRDPEFDGYYWTCEEDGRVKDDAKVLYGHAFLIYGFSEHALLTGDARSRDEAERLFGLLMARAADLRHGGFHEHFDREFRPTATRPDRRLHKSLDVHMHLMEALTALCELTGATWRRQALEQVIGLIFERMTDPGTGAGISVFAEDWTPLANVKLETVWGADRFDEGLKGPEITSYGHNVELAWLYLHALDVLGLPRAEGQARVEPIFDHTCERGVDWRRGGLYVEGRRDGEATERTKEFWQQAEALVGFLDAYALTGEAKFLDAFRNVHDFVFGKMIAWDPGEWLALLAEDGTVLWDHLGTSWKVLYHTVRGMCEVIVRLRRVVSGA